MTPSEASRPMPRSRVRRKSGRAFIGTAHTRSKAFWAALVTPNPASSEVTSPITMAATLPCSVATAMEFPTAGI